MAARTRDILAYGVSPIALVVGAFCIRATPFGGRSLSAVVAMIEGVEPAWSPAVAWLADGLVALAGAGQDPAATAQIVVWLAPALGASTVLSLYGITLHYFDARVAIGAGAILAILPAHVWLSDVGTVDDRVVVALMTTLLLGAGAALLGQEQASERPTPECVQRAAFLGVAMGLIPAVVPSLFLHVLIVQSAYVVRVVVTQSRASAVGWARTVALANGIAAVAIAPVTLGRGGFEAFQISLFQPTWFAGWSLGLVALAEIWRRGSGDDRVLQRATSAAPLAALAAGLLVLSAGDIGAATAGARALPFEGGNGPLFDPKAFWPAATLLSRFVWLAPMIGLLVVWDRRHDLTPSFGLLIGWGVVVCVAMTLSRGFIASAVVVYAMLLAAGIDAAVRLALRMAGHAKALRVAVAIASVALVGWGLWPCLAAYTAQIRYQNDNAGTPFEVPAQSN